jgi:hypothetical protein
MKKREWIVLHFGVLGLLGLVAWSAALQGKASGEPSGAPVLPTASQRFAQDTDEVPSFRRHIIPLAGRLGCNGRACHGSFQGQGGFRLSLFGYDFDADHKSMFDKSENYDVPRIDLRKPEESLIVFKPTHGDEHGGGERMKPGSWQYRMFVKWIAAGAKNDAADDADFVSLEVTPQRILFTKPGETVQLRVVVTWSDGSREDVTSISRFQTNDETVATVDENGLVTCTGRGDSHVVAFYDNGVSPVQVLLPVSDQVGPRYPQVAATTKVDQLVVSKLRELGIVPSEVCTDAEFLRRVSLDLTGTLPSPDEVRAFLADNSPHKRARKIDELLNTPSYAAWWTTRLCDWTGANPNTGGENNFRNDQYVQWYAWLYKRVAENVPYDKIVEGIVLANGRQPGQSFQDYCQEMTSLLADSTGMQFAERETMPHFWSRNTLRLSKDKALSFAYSFLGVRLQCAECHKHPFDQWTKQDFDQFTAFFDAVRYGTRREDTDTYRKMQTELENQFRGLAGGQLRRRIEEIAREGKTIPWREVYVETRAVATPRRATADRGTAGRVITPKLLGGEEVLASEYPDPRIALMEWMRDRNNPYFARSLVNRVWANYFNVGIVEPPDDMNLANPPSNAALLEYLTQGFIDSGYDLKWLHREICNSDTYQRSWRPNDTNALDTKNFSRAVPRRLPAEVAYDALQLAAASNSRAAALRSSYDERSIGPAAGTRGRNNTGSYALAIFGRPERLTNCDCERSNEPSLLQTVFLRNDQELWTLLDRGGWLTEVSRTARGGAVDTRALVEEAFLRTLSRLPSPEEMERSLQHIGQMDTPLNGVRDLLWALINTKEFLVNH